MAAENMMMYIERSQLPDGYRKYATIIEIPKLYPSVRDTWDRIREIVAPEIKLVLNYTEKLKTTEGLIIMNDFITKTTTSIVTFARVTPDNRDMFKSCGVIPALDTKFEHRTVICAKTDAGKMTTLVVPDHRLFTTTGQLIMRRIIEGCDTECPICCETCRATVMCCACGQTVCKKCSPKMAGKPCAFCRHNEGDLIIVTTPAQP